MNHSAQPQFYQCQFHPLSYSYIMINPVRFMEGAREERMVSAYLHTFFCGSHSTIAGTTLFYFLQSQMMLKVAHFDGITQQFLQL